MTIDEHIADIQQRYDSLQTERNDLVQRANDMLTELNKLEGEFRVLTQLKAEKESKVNKKATTIEAVPEEK